jgi:short-subunit dehydrogenase
MEINQGIRNKIDIRRTTGTLASGPHLKYKSAGEQHRMRVGRREAILLALKKIFLTGASSGIGRAIAIVLTEVGHEVWGTSRDVSRLPKMARFHPVQLDLSDPNSIDHAFSYLGEAGNFDVLINNAGSGHFGPAESLSAAEIASQFQVLVFGHLQLTRLALNAMQARGHGLIINVTSLASRLPVPFMAAYNAAKAAMAAFTMSMQLELANSQVHIVDLQPGDICTAFNDAVSKSPQHDSRYKANLAKTWKAVDRNMKTAPAPKLVARQVLKLIDQTDPPPRITVGDTFQTKIAPVIFRFLPQRLRIWGLKKYYGI